MNRYDLVLLGLIFLPGLPFCLPGLFGLLLFTLIGKSPPQVFILSVYNPVHTSKHFTGNINILPRIPNSNGAYGKRPNRYLSTSLIGKYAIPILVGMHPKGSLAKILLRRLIYFCTAGCPILFYIYPCIKYARSNTRGNIFILTQQPTIVKKTSSKVAKSTKQKQQTAHFCTVCHN